MRVLVTGSDGFIGSRVSDALRWRGHEVTNCDVADDILSPTWVDDMGRETFDRCIHLAAHKYATTAEDCPEQVADLNIRGTANVVRASGCPVILASTCKAADPCTVYGASKLIAERIVLNAGGVVVRLVNVVGSTGSVVDLWDDMESPLPVTDCKRMWISPNRAVDLFLRALDFEPGRYAPQVGPPTAVAALAETYFPNHKYDPVPLRRGDRPVERLVGEYETAVDSYSGTVRIYDCWEDLDA